MSTVERGIAIERACLGRYKYLVVLLKRELDYEGLWEYLELIAGFDNRRRAILRCDQIARATFVHQYVVRRDQWQARYIEPRQLHFPGFKKYEAPEVDVVYSRVDLLHNGTGFHSLYLMWWVLEDKSSQRIGPALYRFVNDDSAWHSYFGTIGEAGPQETTG